MSSLPVICINLDRRPDRWKQFNSQPGLQGVTVERYPAIDGQTISFLTDARISPETRLRIESKSRRSHSEINTSGAIGCSLSHYFIWSKLQSPFTLICEDDTQLPPGFLRKVESLLATIPETVDLWILGWRAAGSQVNGRTLEGSWQHPPPFWGTNCYVIRKTAVPKLTAEFFPIESHLDRYFQVQDKLGHIQLAIYKGLQVPVFGSGTDIQLHACTLCNLPDDLREENLMIINKYFLYGLFAYAFGVTFFLGFRNKDGKPS